MKNENVSIARRRELRKKGKCKKIVVSVFILMMLMVSISNEVYADCTKYSSTLLNIRSAPEGNVIGRLAVDEPVTVTGSSGKWSHVITSDGKEGWVWTSYLAPKPVSPDLTAYIDQAPDYFIREKATDNQYGSTVYYWNNIPQYMRDLFEQESWTVIVTTKDFWSENGRDVPAAGACDYTQKCLYLNPQNLTYMQRTVYHEYGHYMDGRQRYRTFSGTKEAATIWKEEYDALVAFEQSYSGNMGSPDEYFAEAFMMFSLYPETMDAVPKTVEMIQEAINETFPTPTTE